MSDKTLQIRDWRLDIGASITGNETTFRVWAPCRKQVDVLLAGQKPVPLSSENEGYFSTTCKAKSGDDYSFVLDGKAKRPDPASRFQPKGVHGYSRIIDPSEFEWTDNNWRGVQKENLLIYELHVGTFTQKGDFESIIENLPYLRREVGVSALELMPVGQFPGTRNWGYDGTYLFAPQNSYGGPKGLKKLVDSCHAEGLAVILDVVYNHVGPEGNYLGEYGPYFSAQYHTPWGEAMNFDDSSCDEVRHFVTQNALYWISEFHIDGLRLDAIHGIFDFSPRHILLELSELTHLLAESLGRQFHLIAESDLNDPRIIKSKESGGYDCDSQWSDDFHHSVHTYLTGEHQRHYQDFGKLEDIAKALKDGFVYDGKYSKYRKRRHGAPTVGLSGDKFVIFTQDHDQVGNRPGGERLSVLVSPEKLKLAAALCLLSSNIPLLFMGEEYAETAPFCYFIDHSDRKLIEAVRKGRRKELEFDRNVRFIDPQSVTGFNRSKIDLDLRKRMTNVEIFRFYKELISLRKSRNVFADLDMTNMCIRTDNESEYISVLRKSSNEEMLILYSFGNSERRIPNPVSEGTWTKILDSSGKGEKILVAESGTLLIPPTSVIVYSKMNR
ncbi:MAG: malto-oligosyltrehalose trehalohydrolase [Nitrososphaerota archaeon]|nr:malto-oligosyltrehalose trehalohydrolase [Nitrososphaerota archaeon]MDG6922861.1 malto-oligosyltrehalose trehalohydrolase [Nitrososphaerota archaeon]